MAEKEKTSRTRPFFLAVLVMALLVHTATLAIVFLLAVIFNGWITNTVNEYFPEQTITRTNIVLVNLSGFLLNSLSFSGAYSLWHMKRWGLYLFAVTSILFLLLPFMLGYGNYTSLIILGVVIGFLFLYYRRLK